MLPERQSPAAGAQKGRVRLVLFHDENGKVLVLVPARRLLNLASLWSLTGRHLRTVRPEDAARFFGQNGLQSEAGQKRLMESLPLVIDQCLRGGAELPLYELFSGLQFLWRPLQEDGQQLSWGDISLEPAIARVQQQPSGAEDTSDISRAVERFTALRIQQRLQDTLGPTGVGPHHTEDHHAALQAGCRCG